MSQKDEVLRVFREARKIKEKENAGLRAQAARPWEQLRERYPLVFQTIDWINEEPGNHDAVVEFVKDGLSPVGSENPKGKFVARGELGELTINCKMEGERLILDETGQDTIWYTPEHDLKAALYLAKKFGPLFAARQPPIG